MLSAVLFVVLAVVAIAAGVIVFRTDSMARATYALAVSFVAVGIMLLQLELEYIGVITILMMVMEMAIMAIFMVMFMGMNPALMPMDMVHNKKASAGIAAGVFALLTAGILLADWPARRGVPAVDLTVSLGETIMGPKMLVMLTVSPVLFATLVSALVLANPRGRYAPSAVVPVEPENDDGGTHQGGGHDGHHQHPGGAHS
ncbi:NADH-quinone oxidoreductase subunit J [Pseudarthrobacter sp. S6]|uniref:NADH-quinone oxidoreductase subunit J n=1 Tax=Pseudarthrobacter sp. S6 TaxID=3418420 RepID=UPI003CF37974